MRVLSHALVLLVLTRLEHLEEAGKRDSVVNTPLAIVAVGHGEVVLRGQLLEATCHEIATHIGEVDVATIEEVGGVALARKRGSDVGHVA